MAQVQWEVPGPADFAALPSPLPGNRREKPVRQSTRRWIKTEIWPRKGWP